MQLPYRRDIDGLRALAVMAVLSYHAFPEWIRGGFVGVDIFFVISGYLITSILLNDLQSHDFKLSRFYGRRVRRIFPALALVLTSCLAYGWFTLLPNDYAALGKHSLAGASFVSNILLWGEAGYFDAAAESKPLLHLWSLGIEEQFYIVWPLLLFGLVRSKIPVSGGIVGLLIASFVTCMIVVSDDTPAAFYSPFTRGWELLAGAALAQLKRTRNAPLLAPASAAIAACVGVALLAASLVLLHRHVTFPGWNTWLPVAGTVLLIAAGPQTWINRTLFSNRPVVFVGLISYPLYLWHWPLLVLPRLHDGEALPPSSRIVSLLLAFVLAYATYRWVERPLRVGNHVCYPVRVASVAMLLVALVAFAGWQSGGAPWRLPPALRPFATYHYDYTSDARVDTCWLGFAAAADGYASECVDAPSNKQLTVLWGDSHAARFYAGLREVKGAQWRLAQFTRDSCPPILNFGYDTCQAANAHLLEKMRLLRPQRIILFGVWNRYETHGTEKMLAGLQQTLAALHTQRVPEIIVIGPVPQWNVNLPDLVLRDAAQYARDHVSTRLKDGLEPQVRVMDARLHALVTASGARYVSAWNVFCDHAGCITSLDKTPHGLTSWDYGHLTTPAARHLAEKLP